MLTTLRLQKRLGAGVAGLAFVTWLLLIFGSTVRVHGAGLACPDWPLCFGEVIPTFDFSVFLEWGHRVLASAVSLGFLALGGAILAQKELRAAYLPHLVLMALVLATQVLLGWMTVAKLLVYWSVTLHLLFGNAFLALMIALAVRLRGGGFGEALPRRVVMVGWVLAAAVAVQLALGGLVSSNYAGLACKEWPTCSGGVWFPQFAGPVGLHLFHRFGGYTLLVVSGALVWLSRGTAAAGGASAILVLVLAQVALGVANVLAEMPVELAIAHAAVAHAIVGTTTFVVTRLHLRAGTA